MKLKILLFFVFLYCFQFVKSQELDSLYKILETNISDSLKIEVNQKIAKHYYNKSVYDSASLYYIFAYDIVSQIKQGKAKNVTKLKKEENKLLKQNWFLLLITVSVLIVIIFFAFLLLYIKKKFKKTNYLLEKKNAEIKAQKERLEDLNKQMFASNLKIDQQNLDLLQKNKEIQLQSEKLTGKTIDLLVLNREIRQTAKLREGLTNMIVHDLKNPISSIIKISENKEITYFAKEILTMVENILDVQKYEGVMMPLNKRDYSLREITDSAKKQVEVFAEHKNIKIENKILKKHHVIIDDDIIRRVFVNLLSNAIKYTPANGLIQIDFEIKSDKKDCIIVKVIDNGIGIKQDKIDIIFNKFKQVMSKKTGLARSTGLGLTFCKLAIEAHDSKIVVDSEPGKHTTFAFSFKLSKKTNYDNKNENKIVFELDTKLNKDDQLYLQKYFKELKSLDVYEIGKLRKVTIQIDENFSKGIQKWKDKLEKSIYNCNSELYTDIVNSIIKK